MRKSRRSRSGHCFLAGVVLLALAGCGSGGGGDGDADRLRFEQPPEVAAGPSSLVPLARILNVIVSEPARLEITASDGSGHVVGVDAPDPSTTHAQPILGLKPDRTYQVMVAAVAADGERREWDQPLSTTTDPLPDNFPVLDVRIADAARMEPGFTLFGLRSKNVSASYLVILDAAGDVVWFLATSVAAVVTPLANGTLAYITGNRQAIHEVNYLGETVHTWYAARLTDAPPGGGAAVDSFAFHNDIFEVPADGTLLVPVQETRIIDEFPTNEEDESVRETATVLDEPIIEIDRAGTIVRRWDFLDILNPRRISFDSTIGLPGAADWVHTNAVTHDPRDDSLFVSFRHQDAVVKVSRAGGALEYILGNHDNWEGFEEFLLTPVGEPFEWPYHQHAPQITAEGTLLLFDNGNHKASPFTGEEKVPAAINDSRAVEYEIDEDAKTIRQVWEYVHPEQLYAPFVGSAYQLPMTRNVLITYGGLCTIDGVFSDDIAACRGTARIIEVDRGESDTVVFDVFVSDRDPIAFGWLIYRSLRLASFGG